MKQYEAVIEALEENNGFATLGYLYQNVDVSNWKTKTPFASIRRIVQQRDEIFRIKPGLWALKDYKDKLPLHILPNEKISRVENNKFNHAYYQGLLVEIGNIKKYSTYVPYQDKNQKYLKNTLSSITTVDKFYEFTYPELIRYAITVDVVWFNNRKMPSAFFEIEHSTNIKNSLNKFVELQDFYSKFNIVADRARKREFLDKLTMTSFEDIKKRVNFIDYESLSKIHAKTYEFYNLKQGYEL